MRIRSQREEFVRGVTVASAVAPARSPKPILCGLRLCAGKDGLEILASDLDVSVRSRVREVMVEEPGEVVLTAQMLLEILRSVEASEIVLATSGRSCEITATDASYKLVTQDAEEFPDLRFPQEQGCMVPRVFLEEMFTRTAYAAARDVGRYAINGVLVELGGGEVRFVATDGRRLAVATRPLPDASFELRRAIVPIKALTECLRGSADQERVRVLVGDDQVAFSSDWADVSAKLVEGEFPDYAAVIPREHAIRIEVARDDLFAAVKKVSVMAGEEMRSVRLALKGSTLEVMAQHEGRGEARASVEVQVDAGKDLLVDFNPDFLADFLKPLPSQMITMSFRDPNAAAVLRPDGSDDLYVLMPITTN